MVVQATSNIIFPQWYAGIGVMMLVLQLGIMGVWSSPTLAILLGPDSPIPVSLSEASWIASLLNFGRFFGAALGCVSVIYFGSKRAIFATLIPIALGWLGIAFANNVIYLEISRLLGGIGNGMSYCAFPLYLGEVSEPRIRGALLSVAAVGAPVGMLIACIVSAYLSITLSATIYFTHCLLLMMMFLWLPESPHHLVKIGKFKAARESVTWYRSGRGVDAEMEAVQKFVSSDGTQSFIEKIKEFKTAPIRKATFQAIALFGFMQICGLNSIIMYMEIILTNGKFTLFKPSLAVVCASVVSIGASIVSIFLIDRCGRKFLLLLASFGTTISMLGLMSHYLLIDAGLDVSNLQWLPLVSIFVYMFSFYVGLMPVPSTILSEIFPANIKGIAASIASLTGAATSFLASKTYQPMVDIIGEAYVFLCYGLFSLLLIPYVLLFMMETKGKSLQEIQNKLMRKT